tara:strand:+ start:16639 stop:17025 length:387 start_codon:yes stop_codon:yes gene_type:complete
MRYDQIKEIEEAVFLCFFKQCEGIEWIEQSFFIAWESFKNDGWNFDGATFVREKNNNFLETAAFIHDYLNLVGYVGKKPDLYFIKIMIALNYGENIIFERCKWLQWTWINYFWHWLRGKKPKNKIPII